MRKRESTCEKACNRESINVTKKKKARQNVRESGSMREGW